jgi:glucose/arabinose dehydrogenase/uncharacterized cupredoxin-like copper-binding protein
VDRFGNWSATKHLGPFVIQGGDVTTVVGASEAAGPTIVSPDLFSDELVAEGFPAATSADFLPDGRILVLTLRGHVYLVDPSEGSGDLLLEIPEVNSAGERGSLDIAVPPDFASTSRFYVYYAQGPDARLRVSSFLLSGSTASSASEEVVWENPGVASAEFGTESHIGGSLNIGPDDRLYLSVGDARVDENAQSLDNVFGKVLRFNRDGTVPTDNPFYDGPDGPNIDEIWAYGLRNPYRGSFDEATGTLWMGDVGGEAQTGYEEVNIVTSGGNYGWPTCQGPLGLPKNGPVCPSGVTAPVQYYAHDEEGGCCRNRAIIGGEVYRGDALPALTAGAYVYGDYPAGEFYFFDEEAFGRLYAITAYEEPLLVWLGFGSDGYLYYIGWPSGRFEAMLRRLVPADAVEAADVEIVLDEWSIAASAGPLEAGELTFAVRNDGVAPHQFTVIRTDLEPDDLPTVAGQADETELDVVGKSETFGGGESVTANFELAAGSYVLVCNIPTHYDQGMSASFTVAE